MLDLEAALSGTRDAFCTPALMDRALVSAAASEPKWTHHWIEGADHGLRVPKRSGRSRADVLAEITAVCRKWLAGLGD
ncbi:MAG TPA: alpha/beta family hydrolase [Fibrobacteria bacterium]|nr:alpha/beta family hydrolase [Fibrobacteria bacterium]